MKLSADEFEDVTDRAQDFLRGDPCDPTEFAEALVKLADHCVIGVRCARHADMIHGQEAEELRTGVERIISNIAHVEEDDAFDVLLATRKALTFLLDHIDARDSLAFNETSDSPATNEHVTNNQEHDNG